MKSLGFHQVTLQLPTEVYEKLRELASADGSLNNAAIDAIMRTPMRAGVDDSEWAKLMMWPLMIKTNQTHGCWEIRWEQDGKQYGITADKLDDVVTVFAQSAIMKCVGP